MENRTILDKARCWVNQFVIRLNLCPFAAHPMKNDLVRFVVYEGTDLEGLLTQFLGELELMAHKEPLELETTLLVIPNFLQDFRDYLDALDTAEAVLRGKGYTGILQVASFHPDYQFGGTAPEDLENHTNRSPFPMFHILREASLEKAIDEFGDTSTIPADNIALMRKLGKNFIKQLNDLC